MVYISLVSCQQVKKRLLGSNCTLQGLFFSFLGRLTKSPRSKQICLLVKAAEKSTSLTAVCCVNSCDTSHWSESLGCTDFSLHVQRQRRMSNFIYFVDINSFVQEDLAQVVAVGLDCVMQRVAPERIGRETIDSALAQLVVNATQNVHLASVRVLCKDVHQVLVVSILALHNGVVSGLGQQCQNQVEFSFVKGVLHRKHVIVLVIEDQVSKALLLILNRDSEAATWGFFILDFVLVFFFFWLGRLGRHTKPVSEVSCRHFSGCLFCSNIHYVHAESILLIENILFVLAVFTLV